MTEQIGNSLDTPTTSLAGSITASDTSLTVASAASLPASGTFRVRIGSELITVGARTGTTLSSLGRGVEGTVAAAHSLGADVDLVLTAGGLAAYVTENGGSQPIPDTDNEPSSFLGYLPEDDSTAQPALSEIDHSLLLIQGWSAETDYSLPFVETDVVILLKPTGSANLFAAEINGQVTDSSEPDWDGDAPNVGDDISDGDVTWYNVGVYATWLATTPVPFEVDTEYAAGTLLWPPSGSENGHLYVVYPPGPFVASSPPDFPTDGTYASGDSGYAYDMGPNLTLQWASAIQNIVANFNPRLIQAPLVTRTGNTVGNSGDSLTAYNDDFAGPIRSGDPDLWLFKLVATNVGLVRLLTDTDTEVSFDAGGTNGHSFLSDYESKGRSQVITTARFIVAASAAIFRGASALPSDADLVTNGDWAIAASDTAFLVKKKTSAGAIKTLTIPWD